MVIIVQTHRQRRIGDRYVSVWAGRICLSLQDKRALHTNNNSLDTLRPINQFYQTLSAMYAAFNQRVINLP